MNTLLAFAAQVLSSTSATPVPACSEATAARVAQIAAADPRDEETLDDALDLLALDDGAACLVDSWVIPKLYVAHERPEPLTRALAAALASQHLETARRAARVARIIGVASHDAYATIVTHYRVSSRALSQLRADLGAMPEGAHRAALTRILATR